MGGNVTAISKSGKQTKAEKIPIKTIGRQKFVKVIQDLLKQINKDFKKLFKTELWTDEKQIANGFVFNGSTSFIMNPEIPDEEIIKYKESAGDLDIAVPEYQRGNLWEYLDSIDSKEVIQGVTYMGSNKPTKSSVGMQINCVFMLDFDGLRVPAQIDFEFLPFSETGIPTEWAKFSHSSSFDDCKAGVKAVHHKYILRALVGAMSVRSDIVIATNTSTYDNIKISKSVVNQNPRTLKFSVIRGIRQAYKPLLDPNGNPVYVDGKQVFKESPTSDGNYVTDVMEMFKLSFKNAENIEEDSKKFWSFMGVLDLLDKYADKEQIDKIHERYLQLLWEPGTGYNRGQELEALNPELDYKVKIGGYLKFIERFGLEDKSKEICPLYYQDYGQRLPKHLRNLEESFIWYLAKADF